MVLMENQQKTGRTPMQPRLQEIFPYNWVGWWKKSIRSGPVSPWRGLRGKETSHGPTLTLESQQVKLQAENPSPGLLGRGDKPPWLLGQIEWLKKPRLHLWGLCRYWLVNKQGLESSALKLPSPCIPNPSWANIPARLTPHMAGHRISDSQGSI